MTIKEAISIIEEYANIYSSTLIHPEDCEAFTMALSALRSEYMEEQAGADQKAWEARSCNGCKHEHKSLFVSPCCNCNMEIRSKWEAKENG